MAGVAEGVSAVFGGIATVLECTDGGTEFDCYAGIAATLIPMVSGGVIRELGRRHGDDVVRRVNAGLAILDFAASTAALARDRRC